MDTEHLTDKFLRIGARLKLASRPPHRFRTKVDVVLDIGSDRHGEFFEITPRPGTNVEVSVLDVQPADRHLLLLVREGNEKNKYLCGHDERHWFVAGIPENASVGTVRQAKEALKPAAVQLAQSRRHLRSKARNRRKNAAFVRQGEWFFIPVPDLVVNSTLVLRAEPLQRGNGGKAHWAEYCYRTGGETVYVCSQHPTGMTASEYRDVLRSNAQAKRWNWRTMQRNPGVYVRGRIRHPDHKTIMLNGWHQVVMNTENQSRAMRNVAFLD